jgi:hypothetical protein
MDDAKAEVLAFTAFTRAHWRKIWSTNPLERVNTEIKRRSRVAGIFPTTPPSSGSSARSCSTCTTSGSPATAATSLRDPWPSSTSSAIMKPTPPSRAASRHRGSPQSPQPRGTLPIKPGALHRSRRGTTAPDRAHREPPGCGVLPARPRRAREQRRTHPDRTPTEPRRASCRQDPGSLADRRTTSMSPERPRFTPRGVRSRA